jgi:hypothetical protein
MGRRSDRDDQYARRPSLRLVAGLPRRPVHWENCVVGGEIEVEGPFACNKGIRAGGAITGRHTIHAGQGIECGSGILCESHLEASWGIKACAGITAHGAIKAGESLQAGEDIRAGDGHAIFAGPSVRVDAWEASARVRARHKPDRLLSGWWCSS